MKFVKKMEKALNPKRSTIEPCFPQQILNLVPGCCKNRECLANAHFWDDPFPNLFLYVNDGF